MWAHALHQGTSEAQRACLQLSLVDRLQQHSDMRTFLSVAVSAILDVLRRGGTQGTALDLTYAKVREIAQVTSTESGSEATFAIVFGRLRRRMRFATLRAACHCQLH